MSEIDRWIEIAKECNYLPENDLKVGYTSAPYQLFYLMLWICKAHLVSLRIWPNALRVWQMRILDCELPNDPP